MTQYLAHRERVGMAWDRDDVFGFEDRGLGED